MTKTPTDEEVYLAQTINRSDLAEPTPQGLEATRYLLDQEPTEPKFSAAPAATPRPPWGQQT